MVQRSKAHAFDRPFERVAKWLLARGIRPNHLTFLQIPVLAGMVWTTLQGQIWPFFWLSWIIMLLDGADGIVARVGGTQSRSGAIMDASLDTLGIMTVLWAATQFLPDQSWVWWSLLALNAALYAQNILLKSKVVSYVRGPVILAMVVPDLLWLTVVGTLAVTGWLIFTRLPDCLNYLLRQAHPTRP
jgi:phosphatidylglycerophosphate synthase